MPITDSDTPERGSGQVFSTLCLCFSPFCSPLRAAAWPLVSRCNYNFPFPPQGWFLSSLVLKEPLQAFSEMQKEGSCPSLALRRRKGSPPSLSNSLNVECQSTSSANPEAPGLCGSLPLDMVLGWQEKLRVHSEVVQAVTPLDPFSSQPSLWSAGNKGHPAVLPASMVPLYPIPFSTPSDAQAERCLFTESSRSLP